MSYKTCLLIISLYLFTAVRPDFLGHIGFLTVFFWTVAMLLILSLRHLCQQKHSRETLRKGKILKRSQVLLSVKHWNCKHLVMFVVLFQRIYYYYYYYYYYYTTNINVIISNMPMSPKFLHKLFELGPIMQLKPCITCPVSNTPQETIFSKLLGCPLALTWPTKSY